MDDGLWRAYLSTVLSITTERGIIEVRHAAQGLTLASLSEDPVHVITAWNPGSTPRDRTANDAALRELRDELAEMGELGGRDPRTGGPNLRTWPAWGVAPDSSWAEESVAVAGLSRSQALMIADRHHQAAIFEWSAPQATLSVVACNGQRCSIVPAHSQWRQPTTGAHGA